MGILLNYKNRCLQVEEWIIGDGCLEGYAR
jgi:hypothetical protein